MLPQLFLELELYLFTEKVFNMKKDNFDKISAQILDLKNLPNSELINIMDELSLEFDEVKKRIIDLTFYLDKLELMYNQTLKEYEFRKK